MSHACIVYDTDPHFIIDGISRAVKNVSQTKSMLVQYDHNSERFTFELPRFIDGHDMLLRSEEAATREQYAGIYEVDDLQLSENDPDTLVFSWLISGNATQRVGPLYFVIRFACTTDGVVNYAWNTVMHSAVSIVKGIYNSEVYEQEYVDIIAQWQEALFSQSAEGVLNITQAQTAALESVQAEGAQQIASIAQTAQNERNSIEQKGLETLDSIPDEYAQVSSWAERAFKEKAPAIVCEASGEVISLSDASDMELAGLKLFGKTTQFTTTGKNLFDPAFFTDNGFTETEGVYSGLGGGVYNKAMYFTGFKENTVYTFSWYGYLPEFAGMRGLYVIFNYTDGTAEHVAAIASATNTKYTHSSKSDKTLKDITFSFGTNISNRISQPMLVEGTEIPYEPYTGGIPAPNPDYPQELVSVGASGAIDTTVAGKNLLPFDYKDSRSESNGVVITTNDDGGINFSGTATGYAGIILHTGTASSFPQVFTLFALGEFSNVALIVEFQDADGNSIGDTCTTKAITINLADYPNVAKIRLSVKRQRDGAVSGTIYPMIVAGEATSAEYEPYKAQTITASTPNGLPGIPVSSGGNYTDENGQAWICDEIDFGRGVYVQRVGQATVTDANRWDKSTVTYVDRYLAMLDESGATQYPHNGFCNVCKIEKMPSQVGLGFFDVYQNWTRIAVNFAEYGTTTAADFKAAIPAGGIKCAWVLAEPIETALSVKELAQYAALHSNKPNTTVYTDAGAGLGVKYAADTKNYIDQKLAAISAAMLNA